MGILEAVYDLHVGRLVEVYWRVSRDGDAEARRPISEWKWFTAKVSTVAYVSDNDREQLSVTLSYPPSRDFDETLSRVILSEEELKDDDTGEIFSWRFMQNDEEQDEDDAIHEGADDDDDYDPRKRRRTPSSRDLSTGQPTLATWRGLIGNETENSRNRQIEAIVMRLEELDCVVSKHERLLTQETVDVGSIRPSSKKLNIPALQFLAARLLEFIEKRPSYASRLSQSAKHYHANLPQQHWLEVDSECVLEDFDQIRTYAHMHKRGQVTFCPSYETFPSRILPQYTIDFHNMETLLWLLGVRSVEQVRNLLLNIRYERTRNVLLVLQDRRAPRNLSL